MTLGESLLKSTGWVASGAGFQAVCQLFTLIVLARILTPHDFGVVSAATLVTQISMIFTEFGVGPAVIQKNEISQEQIKVAFTLSNIFGAIVALVIWLLAPFLSNILIIAELTWVLRAYSVVFFIKGFSAVAESLLQRSMNFRIIAKADAVSFFWGYSVAGILCATAGFTYWSLVIAHVCQAAIKAIMITLNSTFTYNIFLTKKIAKQFFHFGFGQTISRIGSYLASQGDSFVVALRFEVENLGEYGRATQLVVIPGQTIGMIIDKVLFPALSSLQNDMRLFRIIYSRYVRLVTILSIPLSLIMIVSAKDIVHVLLGAKWHSVIAPMQVLAFGLPFRLLHHVSDPTARAAGAIYSRAKRQLIYAAAVFFCTLLGTAWGLIGVAIGVVVATCMDSLVMAQLCAEIMNSKLRNMLRLAAPGARIGIVVLAATAFSSLLMWQLNYLPLFRLISHLIFSTIFIGFLLRFLPRLLLGNDAKHVINELAQIFKMTIWQGKKQASNRNNGSN